jgi:ankyrin repeat protein
VAENPIRTGALPPNIVEVARVIVEAGGDQFEYALELVASGRTARECGVQVALIDFFVDAGADPGAALVAALAHREEEAVRALLQRGAPLTLAAAVATGASLDLQLALGTAAIFGRAAAVPVLVAAGADVNAYLPEAFHAHTTPLHQAINAGSLETVRALIAAGADPAIRDKLFDGDAHAWAEHLEQTEIAAYLRGG